MYLRVAIHMLHSLEEKYSPKFTFFSALQARTHAMDNFQHHITEALDFIKDWNFTTKKKAVIKFVLDSLSVFLFWFFFIVRAIISVFQSIYLRA